MPLDKGPVQRDSVNDPAGNPAVPVILFRLDPASGVPTYLQLVQQAEQALRLGRLRQGDQLPRVKDVAGLLAINPNTVLKAYRALEHKGLAVGHPGLGTFISRALDRVGLGTQAELRREFLGWLERADAAGLDHDGIVALATATLRDFSGRGSSAASRGGGSVGWTEGVA
jgi:GntR family transcriptional regulator